MDNELVIVRIQHKSLIKLKGETQPLNMTLFVLLIILSKGISKVDTVETASFEPFITRIPVELEYFFGLEW